MKKITLLTIIFLFLILFVNLKQTFALKNNSYILFQQIFPNKTISFDLKNNSYILFQQIFPNKTISFDLKTNLYLEKEFQKLFYNLKTKKKKTKKYPHHIKIKATLFWIGETPNKENNFISNLESAWDEEWVKHYGGIDSPFNRNSIYPKGFIPKENPFYIALPFSEYNDKGLKKKKILKKIYWYYPGFEKEENKSLLKNRWVKIYYKKKIVYAQWEDAGPINDNDYKYVFGKRKPKNKWGEKAGIDLSPTVWHYLGLKENDFIDWEFIDANNVPKGPWKKIITKSPPFWK